MVQVSDTKIGEQERTLTISDPLTAKATCAANEDGRLILKDDLARGFVLGFHDSGHGRSLAFIKNLEDPAQQRRVSRPTYDHQAQVCTRLPSLI